MFRFAFVLVAVSFSASADIALPFDASVRVETPLYAQSVGDEQKAVKILDGFHFKQTAQVAAPCNGTKLSAEVWISIEPNLMNYGESAFVSFKTGEVTGPKGNACLRDFAAQLTPMNINIELPVGDYSLDIKNPNDKNIVYKVHVAYKPLSLVEGTEVVAQ